MDNPTQKNSLDFWADRRLQEISLDCNSAENLELHAVEGSPNSETFLETNQLDGESDKNTTGLDATDCQMRTRAGKRLRPASCSFDDFDDPDDYDGAFSSIASNIKRGKSVAQTLQFLHNTEQFKKDLKKWRDPDCSLNMLQWAIVHKACDFVSMFYIRFRPSLFITTGHVLDEAEYLPVNFPVHLACWVGHLPTLHFLTSCNFGGLHVVMETVSVINLHQTSTKPSVFKTRALHECQKGKPFEIAVANNRLSCVQFMLDSVILQSNALRFLCGAVREPSQLLHKACSVGSWKLVQLVLQGSFKDVVCMSDKSGKTPLHTAVWNGDTQTIAILLNSGADINACTESKQSCLHILFRSKLHASNYVRNTALFLERGIDLHTVDKNGKSVLHVLAEEIAATDAAMLRFWTQAAAAISNMTSSENINREYTAEMYQRDLLDCLHLLLDHGANPSLQTYQDCGCNTCFSSQHYRNALEVLLHRANDRCLKSGAQFFCDAVALMLCACEKHTQDGKQEFVMCAFTHFVANGMRRLVDTVVQARLIHLFCQHACVGDISVPISRLMQSLVHHSYSLASIQLAANYMPLACLQEVGEEVMKKKVQLLLHSCNKNMMAYGEGLRGVFVELSPRTLQHTCKLCILKLLCHRGNLIELLPLPAFLKMYLSSDAF